MPFIFLYENQEPIYNILELESYKIGYFINQSQEKSTYNEDVLFIANVGPRILMGVADGAGGHPKGKEAAYIVGENMVKAITEGDGSELNMISLIESINQKILALKAGAKTTLSVSLIDGEELYNYSVGDSEIVIWNRQGTEIYSNIPHSDIGYQIEAGVIDQKESLDNPDRYTVNNLLGDDIIRIEATSKMDVKKGHTLVIGSDGLFDNFSHEQLLDIVGTGTFEKSFERLVELCLTGPEKGWKKDDDVSFIVARKIKPSEL